MRLIVDIRVLSVISVSMISVFLAHIGGVLYHMGSPLETRKSIKQAKRHASSLVVKFAR